MLVLSINLTAFTILPLSALTATDSSPPKNVDDMMARRMRSAEKIIDEGKLLQENIGKIRQEYKLEIAQATKLKGEAQVLRGMTPPITGGVSLTPLQLKAVQSQYSGHINEFKQHAEEYQDHLKQFQLTLGECHANAAAFQKFSQDYSLHVDQFHINMPLIRPPHVCGVMDMTKDQVQHSVGGLRVDLQRVQNAQIELAKEENRLNEAQKGIPAVNAKLESSAIRENQEKALYDEFGRLRTEYDLLKTEKTALASVKTGSAALTSKNVAGKIKGQ